MKERARRLLSMFREAPAGAIAWMYNTPLEDGRWLYGDDRALAEEVYADDAHLIVWIGEEPPT